MLNKTKIVKGKLFFIWRKRRVSLPVHIMFTLHPVYLLEELVPSLPIMLPDFFLYAVPKVVVACSLPEIVNGLQIDLWNELDLQEQRNLILASGFLLQV